MERDVRLGWNEKSWLQVSAKFSTLGLGERGCLPYIKVEVIPFSGWRLVEEVGYQKKFQR